MAKILVAASPEPRAIVERVLAGHELCCAGSMDQAEQVLGEQSFDLIVCTVAFDDSRMLDLLQLVKSKPGWKHIPFVGARVRAHVVRSPTSLEATAFTCRAMGAAAFLDIASYRKDPERELREAIEQCVSTGSGEFGHGTH
jgi:CheY-like chemotaxis protein